jgi:hypothetical protein
MMIGLDRIVQIAINLIDNSFCGKINQKWPELTIIT